MTTSTAASLAIMSLSAGYPRRPVLHELTLAPLGAGEVTALVGPNGAGKSTLMRVLAGLLSARGSARLGTLELIGAPATVRSRDVAFMPQMLPQRVSLTVLESVIGAIKASPVAGLDGDTASTQRRAMESLERVGIADLALDRLDQLSGGQRQLAGIAQALARDPKLLLLDEPTSALDLGHQVTVMTLVRALAAEGRIVVLVLHDLTLAVRWADRVVMLHHGRVHSDGAPKTAMTPAALADVYGVRARVEHCSRGLPHIIVDGLVHGA